MFIVVTAVISNKSGVFDWPLLPMGDSSSDPVSHGKALIKEEYSLSFTLVPLHSTQGKHGISHICGRCP
jgi:hypothetical protein